MSSDESASDSSASEAENDIEDAQTDESSAPKRKMLLTKKLPEQEETLKNLDRKSQRKRSSRASSMLLKRRGTEIASARLAPVDAPRWAVKA